MGERGGDERVEVGREGRGGKEEGEEEETGRMEEVLREGRIYPLAESVEAEVEIRREGLKGGREGREIRKWGRRGKSKDGGRRVGYMAL